MRPLVQEPMNTVSTRDLPHGRARRQVHVGEGAGGRLALGRVEEVVGRRAPTPSMATTWAGLVPHVTCGREGGGVE